MSMISFCNNLLTNFTASHPRCWHCLHTEPLFFPHGCSWHHCHHCFCHNCSSPPIRARSWPGQIRTPWSPTIHKAYECVLGREAQSLAPGISLLLTRVFHCPTGLPRKTQAQRCNYQKFQGGNSRA